MSDFVGGLKSASDYINTTRVGFPSNITGDIGTGTVTAQMQSFSLKEIVCGILAGNGFKLPNLQLCLKINLSRLIPALPAALDALRGALLAAEAALEAFIQHTGLDALLGRLNSAIAEFASIANMINFCGTPVIPRPIPNVLRDMMGSFTGAGHAILDELGVIADSDIGGCIGVDGIGIGPGGISGGGLTGVNFGIFQRGALRDIGDVIERIKNNPALDIQADIDRIKSRLKGFARDMEELIEFENNYKATDTSVSNSSGGSIFSQRPKHTGVGCLPCGPNVTHTEAHRKAIELQSVYDKLSQYIIDDDGNNIFYYFLEPELRAKLEEKTVPQPTITQQEPVYNYCGQVIGYTNTILASQVDTSSGLPLSAYTDTQPATTGLQEAEVGISPSPANTSVPTTTAVREDYPDTPIGREGDRKGDLASDGQYLYYATADFDGTSNIWLRSALTSW